MVELSGGSPTRTSPTVLGGKLFAPDDIQFAPANSSIQKKIQERMKEIQGKEMEIQRLQQELN
jgi:hypothetical protein